MFCISNKWHNEPRLYSLLHLCTSLSTRCHTGWKQHQIIGSRDANKLPGTIRRRRKVPEGGHGCWSCTVETQQHTSGLRPCSGCHLKLVWEIWSSVTNLNCLRVRAERCLIRRESVWHTVRLERHQTTTTSRVWLYAPGGLSDASEWEWCCQQQQIHRAENRKLTFRFLVDSLSGQENIRITDGNVPRCSWKHPLVWQPG